VRWQPAGNDVSTEAEESPLLDALYSILVESWVPMKPVRLRKICLNEMYSKVHIGKYLSDKIPIHNGLKQGDSLSPLLFQLCFRICH
jgi:hypothetical protein